MHVTLYSNYDQYQDKAHNRDTKVHMNAVTEVILQSRDMGAAQLSWVSLLFRIIKVMPTMRIVFHLVFNKVERVRLGIDDHLGLYLVPLI